MIYLLNLILLTSKVFAFDCFMFMVHKDQINVISKKSCEITSDNTNSNFNLTDACLAKVTTANGRDVFRLVLSGKLDNYFQTPELIIVEENLTNLRPSGTSLLFSKEYLDIKKMNKRRIDLNFDTDFSTVKMQLRSGILKKSLKYDFELSCH